MRTRVTRWLTKSVYTGILIGVMAGGCLTGPAAAQQVAAPPTGESLRLPEVVITGVDRSRIQRLIPKVELAPPLTGIDATARDRAERLVHQGDGALLRQPRQAEEWYRQAAALDPSYAVAFARVGDACRVQGKYQEAVEAYQQALALKPDLATAHYHLGILAEDQFQDGDQAIEHYQHYVQAGGPDARVGVWLRHLRRQLDGDEPVSP
jgi:tetratricopeptide (TPR) repeat protein